jgi:SWI/SNF-related matrix-associated actin-dependent regulator 1 of chromatin subfamily A
MISDDELDAPIYAGGDSSDDDKQPSRGDIRPSSFLRKEPITSNGTGGEKSRVGSTVSSYLVPLLQSLMAVG